MDLRDLRYFETIAELQHVGRAIEQAAPHAAGADQRACGGWKRTAGSRCSRRPGRGIRLTAGRQGAA